MVDKISKEKRSKIMSAIHSKNTKPEITLRKALFAQGHRYRIHYGQKKADIAFPSAKVAVFIDGCFWHGCLLHSHIPKSNQAYWVPKLRKTIARDKVNTKELQEGGWTVLRFWEHEITNMNAVLLRIEASLGDSKNREKKKLNHSGADMRPSVVGRRQ